MVAMIRLMANENNSDGKQPFRVEILLFKFTLQLPTVSRQLRELSIAATVYRRLSCIFKTSQFDKITDYEQVGGDCMRQRKV